MAWLVQGLVQAQGLIGIGAIITLCALFSERRSALPTRRWIVAALLIQLLLALVIVRVPLVWQVVTLASEGVAAIERATLAGSSYMFGYLGGTPLPFDLKPDMQAPMVIAFQILPLVIVLSAISALLWHWRILQWLVRTIDWALRRSMGVSGPVGLAGGTSLFLGVVEAPMVLRGWLTRMTRSELFTVMVLIMATISGAILVLYAVTLARTLPDAVDHMIAASVISLPAAILIGRMLVPPESAENGAPVAPVADMSDDEVLRYDSSIDAIIRGTMDGMQLFLAVIAVIITIFALVNLVDQILSMLPMVADTPLTVKRLFGWLLSPLMWALGVPWDQAPQAGALMGTKAILNEYVAYLELAAVPAGALDGRSLLITTYALCGVANLASVGLLVSTVGTLAPTRRAEVSALGLKSWVAGNAATAMTGAMVGLVTWAT